MATGRSLQTFSIDDVSEGCNYSDDLTAIKKNQSPDSMNIEFFNGKIRKRLGESAITSPPTGQGGIDTYTKLMLHMDGTDASTTFTDSETTPKSVTALGAAALSTSQSKFGTASGFFRGADIDSSTVLMLHMDDASLIDSALTPKTTTLIGGVTRSAVQSKFGGFSASFNGTTQYLTLADSTDWAFGTGDFTIDCWIYLNALPIGAAAIYSQYVDGSNYFYIYVNASGGFTGNLRVAGVDYVSQFTTAVFSLSTWYHVAFVRASSICKIYVNGSSQTLLSDGIAGNSVPDMAVIVEIGTQSATSFYFNGYIDELRVSKGIARWTANFDVPTLAYAAGDYLTVPDTADWNFGTGDFTVDLWVRPSSVSGTQTFVAQYGGSSSDFWKVQLVGGKLQMVFVVGGVTKGSYVTASVVSMAVYTWYHIAFVRNTTNAYIFLNGAPQTLTTSTAFSTNDVGDITSVLYIGQQGSSDGFFVGYMDELRVSKGIARWTANFTYPSAAYDTFTASSPLTGFSLIDFSDTSKHHQQVAHLGTYVYAYDRITTTKTLLRSGAPYTRSFNAKVSSYLIQTYSDHSAPYYWDGSTSSMAAVSANAPGIKRAIEFQGYMIGMNTTLNPMRCYYQAIGNLLGAGAAYTDYFTLTPAPNDDETSDAFLLNGRLYVGSKYSIFRVSFVGGVTVFEFKQVISDIGIVPGTAQTVITKQFGQVVLFLGTDKRIYMFDGANVKTISDLYYYKNRVTPISLDLIDDNYKENSFAIYDFTKRIYRLFVTKKASSVNEYVMNVDIDTFAYYPFDNMAFSAGTMGYDNLLRPYIVCTDYTGALHTLLIDRPTDNGTTIDEYYTSPLVSKSGNVMKTAGGITLDIVPSSNANLSVYDKVDFPRVWSLRQTVPLAAPRDKFLGRSLVLGSSKLGSEKEIVSPTISVGATFNNYQFKLVSDTPTAPAWEVQDIIFDETVLKMGKAEASR